MKQFTLKFTEENLNRHLAYNPDVIVTTRDERKAEIDDVCVIKGRVYRVTELLFGRIGFIGEHKERDVAKESGFDGWMDYYKEIERIYGSFEKTFYVYTLKALDMATTPTLVSRVDDVEKTVKYLQNLLHDHLQDPNGHGVKGDTIIYSTNE
jgi:hypothetical protein